MTDERTRKNWEEYGNPDGIRTFALGVALPSWLVNSSNRIILLVLYCVAFGIGLPLLVKKWWGRSKIYTKSGLRHASMGMFFRELKENTTLKKLLEILANASEFLDDLPRRPEDEGALKQLHEVIDSSYSEVFEVPKKVAALGVSSPPCYRVLHLGFPSSGRQGVHSTLLPPPSHSRQ